MKKVCSDDKKKESPFLINDPNAWKSNQIKSKRNNVTECGPRITRHNICYAMLCCARLAQHCMCTSASVFFSSTKLERAYVLCTVNSMTSKTEFSLCAFLLLVAPLRVQQLCGVTSYIEWRDKPTWNRKNSIRSFADLFNYLAPIY